MDLPKLSPGKRFALPMPVGSADALLLARLAEREKSAGRLTVIVTADASDAQRLIDEMAFFAPELRTALFPDWETLPYDTFSPHQDLISERLATLWRIRQRDHESGADVVLVPATTALYRLAPPSFLAGYTFEFKQGQKLDEAKLKAQLTLAGYQHVSQVVSHGEYAVRGGLIDLFPMGSPVPYRVDLFDDEIDTIRTFDPDTQRSQDTVPQVRLLPGREFPMDEDARAKFRHRWRELLEGDPTRSRIYKDMGAGVATAGIEYYLPLFFDDTATVFDYLGEDATLVLHGELEPAFQRFWQDTKERYRLVQGDPERPALPPETLFLNAEQFYACAKPYPQLALRPKVDDVPDSAWFQTLPDLSVVRGAEDPLQRLQAHVRSAGRRVLVLAESDGRRESLLDFLRSSHLNPPAFDSLAEFQGEDSEPLGIATSNLMRGFAWVETGIDFVTETELFASTSGSTRRRKKQEQVSDVDALIKDLSELKVGDPVVHSQHGIGRYHGLVNMDVGQKNEDGTPALQEFLHLEYAKNAVLYVPVSQLHHISRYTGVTPESAPLHNLGSNQWEKAKRKAAEQVRDAAAELLNIYARRAAREGHAFRLNVQDYEQFAQDFGFEETADQKAAIHAVIHDMLSPQPMDRLVCGDVGFGKTEVALRAAFKCVDSGRQVMVLCPTTILAQQHYETFFERFAPFGLEVEVLSRFRTPAQQKRALKAFAEGTIDVLIGTHRLLSADVNPKNLGLVIIDEEQRFGVQHKEQLKNLREQIDVLTLSATPIPRTMQMATSGVRDMSLITTPPTGRRPVIVHVGEYDPDVVSAAIRLEVGRGGQVYYVSNRVKTIDDAVARVHEAAPEARVGVAHGKMSPREVEDVMIEFATKKIDVLIATTIVESGIDNATANTLIIEDSQRLGLAQLYQLKGRVGRSATQAYAYFMFPGELPLTEEATARLTALSEFQDLGSGMRIAMRDLEIRGAGSLMGAEQHGNLSSVGFDLFTQMLGQAVAEARGDDDAGVEAASVGINLPADYFLSEEYLPAVDQRVLVYRKLAAAGDLESIDEVQEETEAAHGELPLAGLNLFNRARIRIRGERLGLESVTLSGGRITFLGVDVPKKVAYELKTRYGAVNFPKSRKLSVPYKAGAGAGSGLGRGLDANDGTGPVAAALMLLQQLGTSDDD